MGSKGGPNHDIASTILAFTLLSCVSLLHQVISRNIRHVVMFIFGFLIFSFLFETTGFLFGVLLWKLSLFNDVKMADL